jgi:glutamate formiminotransferase/glutamate formiminotransferase/formiminotetrahydrofolate cyclodeaminase
MLPPGPPTLISAPNVSEGRDEALIEAIGDAFAGEGVRVLDVHSDADHNRSVFTLAGPPRALADALLAGAREAVARIDVVARSRRGPALAGQHPHVGALDVVPLVHLDDSSRGAACAEALVVADRIGAELAVPVFLYGELSRSPSGGPRTRAQLRRGGVQGLEHAIARDSDEVGEGAREPGEALPSLHPDFGPPRLHPTAGATLVAARSPLVAFNLQLAPPASLADARAIAARVREGGERGLPGLRAIGVELTGGIAQVSTNVEQPFELPLVEVLAAVARLAPVASAELVGLAPAAALEGFPQDVPMPGFDPARHILENALVS